MNLQNEFTNYEQALALKELGYDEPCFATYRKDACSGSPFKHNIDFHTKVELDHNLCPKNSDDYIVDDWCSAPLKQQVFKWFREKYGLEDYIRKGYSNKKYFYGISSDGILVDGTDANDISDTYEEAEEACIDKLIEIVKNGK